MSLPFKNGMQRGKAMLQHEVTANIASSWCPLNRLLDLLLEFAIYFPSFRILCTGFSLLRFVHGLIFIFEE